MGQIISEFKKISILMSFDYKLTMLYKVNFIVGFIKKYIFLIINIFLWSFFTQNIFETTIYFLIVQLFSSFFTCDVAEKLSYSISSGSIANELILPIDLRKKMLYESFGMLKFNLIYSFIPTLLILTIVYIKYSATTVSLNPLLIIIVIINIIITYLILYLIELCVGLTAIKTVYAWGVINLKNSLFLLLSGSVIPLFVFGQEFLDIYKYTFFYNMYFFNAELINNTLTVKEAIFSLFIQSCWLIIIYIMHEYIYKKAIGKIEIGGG